MNQTRAAIGWKSAARTFLFVVIGALYTQYTAKPDSTPLEYWKAVAAAAIAALVKGGSAFFSAKDVQVIG